MSDPTAQGPEITQRSEPVDRYRAPEGSGGQGDGDVRTPLSLVLSLIAVAVLTVGLYLAAAMHLSIFRLATFDHLFVDVWPLIGVVVFTLAWLIVPGPVRGRLVGAGLGFAALVLFLFYPYVGFGGPLFADTGLGMFELAYAVLMPASFALALLAWLSARGRARAATVLLVLPVATHLILQFVVAPRGLAWFEQVGGHLWQLGISLPAGMHGPSPYTLGVVAAGLITVVPAAILAALVPAFRGVQHN